MIGRMGGNFISKKTNVVLKIYKILIKPHIEYFSQAWAPVLGYENKSVILRLKGI